MSRFLKASKQIFLPASKRSALLQSHDADSGNHANGRLPEWSSDLRHRTVGLPSVVAGTNFAYDVAGAHTQRLVIHINTSAYISRKE
jgi:hypothetical protein